MWLVFIRKFASGPVLDVVRKDWNPGCSMNLEADYHGKHVIGNERSVAGNSSIREAQAINESKALLPDLSRLN